MIRSRKSNRLREYDYSSAGYCFVTVCARDRKGWFGDGKTTRKTLTAPKIALEKPGKGERVPKEFLELAAKGPDAALDSVRELKEAPDRG